VGTKTLKILRLFIPGLMILFVFLALKESDLSSFANTLAGISFSKESLQFYVVPIVLGVVYYVIDLRKVFFRKPIQQVVNNIYTRLLAPFRDHSKLKCHIDHLRSDPKLKQVFYKFVDSEPDLKSKSDIVRVNGLVLSSLADAAIISLLAFPIYVAFYIWKSTSYYLILAGCSLVAFLVIRLILLPLTLKKHIEYSDEQIDSILANNYSNLENALLGLASQNDGE
jgi:hypothetical protein